MASTKKRARSEEDDHETGPGHDDSAKVDHVTKNDLRAANDTPAARFNRLVIRKLTKALERDPETDLAEMLPSTYSATLAARLSAQRDRSNNDGPLELVLAVLSTWLTRTTGASTSHEQSGQNEECNDQSPSLAGYTPNPSSRHVVEIIHPISSSVQSFLGLSDEQPSRQNLAATLLKSLVGAERTFQSQSDTNHYVAHCSQDLVVKVSEVRLSIITSQRDFTEYTSMQFLARNKPEFPAPRPHGLLVCGKHSYLFMTCVSGCTLESVWNTFTENQKVSLSSDLDRLLLELRDIPFANEAPLGGVAGEGCKYTRRTLRRALKPLHTTEQFYEFLYGHVRNHGTSYWRVLRQVTFPARPQGIFFTHGDLHPANIIVRAGDQGMWRIAGLIDWEMSGFYPEDFECVKATNCLSPIEDDDWYSYLPPCVSPQRHSHAWLADRLWDPRVV